MRTDGKSTRVRERSKLGIALVVRYQDAPEHAWEEETQLREVSPVGAGFYLKRPLEPRRLVHLTMSLPREFRFFDYGAPQYRVWAVVRYVEATSLDELLVTTFSVGVAFIGREPPASYHLDPMTFYDLNPTLVRGGAWVARQQPRHSGKFTRAKEDRYARAFPVMIEAFDEAGQVTTGATAETENVSRHGAALSKTNDVPKGSFVRVTSAALGLSILAVVRGSEIGPGGDHTLHLEFIDGQWPVGRLS